MDTTPLLFQTTPAVVGSVLGRFDAQEVLLIIKESIESGIEHSAHSPFCFCLIVRISSPVMGWGRPNIFIVTSAG